MSSFFRHLLPNSSLVLLSRAASFFHFAAPSTASVCSSTPRALCSYLELPRSPFRGSSHRRRLFINAYLRASMPLSVSLALVELSCSSIRCSFPGCLLSRSFLQPHQPFGLRLEPSCSSLSLVLLSLCLLQLTATCPSAYVRICPCTQFCCLLCL